MGTKSIWKNNKLSFFDPGIDSTHPTGVWATCPNLELLCNPQIGFIFFEDFLRMQGDETATTNLDGWTLTQASTGAVNLSDDAKGGVLELDSNSTTEAYGAQIQYTEGTLPFLPAANKDIWYECRIKIEDTYDKCELFAGLSAVDTSIIAGSDMTSANHIGFECHTDNGVVLFGAEKAGTEATPLSACTLVEDTYVRLGFHVHGVTSIDYFVDGVKQSSTILTANIPIVGLTPSFVCQSGGTNDPIMHIDWFKCVQLR